MSAEQMREEFEAWYTGPNPVALERNGPHYKYMPANVAWVTWQAALATQPQAPQGAVWRPIETAPETTESEDVLLSGKFGTHMGKVFNYGGGDIVVVIAHIAGNSVEGISHFMVIPAAPKEQS